MVMRNLVGVQAVDRDGPVLGSITSQFEEDGRTWVVVDDSYELEATGCEEVLDLTGHAREVYPELNASYIRFANHVSDLHVASNENGKGAFSMMNFTDDEVMESLSGAVMRLNVDSRMVEVVRGDRVMSFGGAPALRHFSAEEKLSGKDYNRLLALDALGSKLGRLSAAGTEVPVVDDGRFIGPVLVVKEGVALQDAGRGKLVGHDMSKLGTPLKPGDKLDVQYANGLVKAARNLTEELAKDGQKVSVAMHTR